MCLEGRVAALLVAPGTVIPGAASGKPPGPVTRAVSTPVSSMLGLAPRATPVIDLRRTTTIPHETSAR
jgi:hypothetical protein